MGELSEQNRALIERIMPGSPVSFSKGALNDLLDAARTEGRGEGEPVASEDQANHDCLAKRRPGEPMFIILGRDPDGHNIVRSWAERRLAAGGDPEHCEMGLATAERMRLYASDPANAPASAPPASAYASPIREPEISRAKRDEIARIVDPLAYELSEALDRAKGEPPQLRNDATALRDARVAAALIKADAILNLAPVGGRGEEGSSSRADLSPASRSPDQHSDGGEG